ncbi:uncharacterized protein LOC143283765 [Babylonia areolata]|uniref:uncharacterized protein LOC143283765 n=1 Tax=Babylonia areolata TaxID=304850 RepID=UPI003FD4E63A
MQIKQTSPGPSRPAVNNAAKQAMAKKQKVQQQRELARQRALEFAHSSSANLPPSQRLSSPSSAQPASKEEVKEPPEPGTKTEMSGQSASADISEQGGDGSKEKSSADGEAEEPGASGVKEIDEKEGLRGELSRMEQFRIQQQKMEEENKQRRRILADAIKQRSKMAKEEAEKLTKVQNELKHLDHLVNADVSIIRDKIEVASIDFLQAQKRYERAEKEFVEAKIALAEKSDLKESLTEHLYTVIQQNEARKAERLAVLMKQLGMEAEDCPVPNVVPPLLSFSPINTLHRPHFPPTSSSTPAPPDSTGQGSNPEHPGKEGGQASQDQATEQCGNKDGVQEAGQDQDKTHTADKDTGANTQTAGTADKDTGANTQTAGGDTVEKKENADCKIEDEKTVNSEKGTDKRCTENGSPESQDGGANTVP